MTDRLSYTHVHYELLTTKIFNYAMLSGSKSSVPHVYKSQLWLAGQ